MTMELPNLVKVMMWWPYSDGDVDGDDGDDVGDGVGDDVGDDMEPAQYGDGDGRVFYSNYRPGWETQSYEAEGAVELLYQWIPADASIRINRATWDHTSHGFKTHRTNPHR